MLINLGSFRVLQLGWARDGPGATTVTMIVTVNRQPPAHCVAATTQRHTHRRTKDQLKNALSSLFEPNLEEANLALTPLTSHKYIFGLTYEKGETSVANRKYRCLIMREDDLNKLAALDASLVDFEIGRTADTMKYAQCRLKELKELHTPGWHHLCACDSGPGSLSPAPTL